eukprot:3813676-Rhodomonas_salina.1
MAEVGGPCRRLSGILAVGSPTGVNTSSVDCKSNSNSNNNIFDLLPECESAVASPNKPPLVLISGAVFCLFLLGPGSGV